MFLFPATGPAWLPCLEQAVEPVQHQHPLWKFLLHGNSIFHPNPSSRAASPGFCGCWAGPGAAQRCYGSAEPL